MLEFCVEKVRCLGSRSSPLGLAVSRVDGGEVTRFSGGVSEAFKRGLCLNEFGGERRGSLLVQVVPNSSCRVSFCIVEVGLSAPRPACAARTERLLVGPPVD